MHSTTRRPARPALPALTGLRAVAAVWVVLFHYREDLLALVPWLAPLDTLMRAGYLGVDLFFPLSGFVLAYTYADRMRSFRWRGTGDFVRNRFARVWPVHVLTLHVDLAIAAVIGTLGVGADGHRRTPQAYVENLAMVHTWFNDRPSFNSPAWSISSEWFAYLLAPLLFVAVARLRRASSALLLATLSYAVMLAVFATMALPNGNLEHMFYVRIMAEFLGGVLLCLAWVRGGARLGRLVVVLPLTLAVLALVPAAAGGHYWAAPALGLGVAALAGSGGWITRALSWPTVVAAGEASYALYMTHLLVQPLVRPARLWAEGSGWASALVVVGLVAVLAAMAWLVHAKVEGPARRRLQAPRRGETRHAEPTTVVAGEPALVGASERS
ncbi:MAG TPA: acyltransferase [Ornithinibacter sp.]|nr:acyltransferase [Ornithinibacter sp.]